MRTVLKSKDFSELVVVSEYPEGLISGKECSEYEFLPEFEGVQGKALRTILDGVMIVQRSMQLKRELCIEVEHDFPFLKMQFEIEGHSSYTSGLRYSKDVLIEHGTQRLFFLPEVKGTLLYPQSRSTLEINLTLNFLERIFGQDLVPLQHFGKAIKGNQPVLLSERSQPISPAMRRCIFDIAECPFHGTLKKVYLESKVIELLILQVERLNTMLCEEIRTEVKKPDLDKFYHAKELISQNIQQPCSLIELAEMAGLNDFKLKRGFKQVFGTTVFGYLNDLRMETAMQLLQEGRLNISEIAYRVGYKHSQHFTAAFKRKYGCLPSEIKG